MLVRLERVLSLRCAAILFATILMALGCGAIRPAQAQDQSPAAASLTTDMSGDVHLGVATCAGGPCHGSAQNRKINGVLQNEYLTWQRYDKHAKAYTVLEGALGQRIARNLGIPAAEKAKICLDCHADNVPEQLRGVQFHIADGVGCEACHGGSKNWLGPHVTGRIPHSQLVSEFGLTALDTPLVRAKNCLQCHWGDETRFVTHKIMGAGHPRLAFELQTFTQIEPAHFVVDDVYRRRKHAAQGAQVWAVGQAVALESMMASMQDPKHRGEGVFPELVFFDCDSCHHPTDNLRWSYRASSGLGPGVPHFNDANALMLQAIALRVDPGLEERLRGEVLDLHAALSNGKGQPGEIAGALKNTAQQLSAKLAAHEFTKDDMTALLRALVDRTKNGDAVDYAGAEQITMATASIVYTMKQDGDLDQAQYAQLKAALDRCYAATQKEDAYQPEAFLEAVTGVGQAVS